MIIVYNAKHGDVTLFNSLDDYKAFVSVPKEKRDHKMEDFYDVWSNEVYNFRIGASMANVMASESEIDLWEFHHQLIKPPFISM